MHARAASFPNLIFSRPSSSSFNLLCSQISTDEFREVDRVPTTPTSKPTPISSSTLIFPLYRNTTTSSSASVVASSNASAVTCGKVSESKRKKDVPENRSLYPFPELIGRGYDISTDLRLKYCKGRDSSDSRLIEIDEDDGREFVLPGGITTSNVSKSIKCDKGKQTRFRSDVLSFQ